MNPATGPHGTPRKAPAVTAETTEDRLRRELAQSSQLRCVCEHLAPTSPPNFEAEDVVDESQEYCDEVVCDLRTLGEEALDDITSRLDDYGSSLLHQILREEQRVGVAKGLKLVCGRWRHALKKNVFCLNARVEEYRDHHRTM